MNAASAHLGECERCRQAVRQQELLKSRMSTVASPALSPQFLASLSSVPHSCFSPESLWSRLRHSRPARFGVALIGASLTVAVVAYAIGGVREQVGDAVIPASERYAADFFDSPNAQAGSTVQATSTLTTDAMVELGESGWPCHETLAGDMGMVDATWLDGGRTIALTYANSIHKLKLFEQNGALDTKNLDGFDRRTINRADVWIRDGIPTIVTWDVDGVVYTIVTDSGRRHLARVLGELPTRAPEGGPAERIGDGLDRMTTWVSPAA